MVNISAEYAVLLSSSRTSVLVKQGLFNAKIHDENGRYIHRLIYELNEQDLLGHSHPELSGCITTVTVRNTPILSSQVVSLPFQSVIHPEDSSL